MAKEPINLAGLKLDQLAVGGLYECVLSGRKVLIPANKVHSVVNGETNDPMEVVFGLVFNSATGKVGSQPFCDYQLKYCSE